MSSSSSSSSSSDRISLKNMTEEEKKERKKVQMREYMYRRRKEDPVFAEKLRENCRVYNKKNPNKVCYDEETRKKYNTEYYKAKKEKLKLLEELLAKSNIN